ncbi:MAG: hypothetical protein HKN95_05980 [Acidimicrobiia bacterium]|nr:hypothetical protein [Acidimicrobiia bacterium]
MRKVIALAFVMALILGVIPTAGAQSAAGPDASTWVQTDSMGAWVLLGPPKDKCIDESWIQTHLTFFRGGVGDDLPEDRFANAGELTAVENGTTTHTGDIWWIATGRTRLEPMNPAEPCNPDYGFPVHGSFHGKGALRITESDGPGPDRAGVTCSLSFQTHLRGTTGPPPVYGWIGKSVAHCDDGSLIHMEIVGPTDDDPVEPGGFVEIATGVIHDK